MTDQQTPTDTKAEPRIGRETLIAAITTFLSGQDAATLEAIGLELGQEIDSRGPAALIELGERLASAGADWSYYPGDPLARRIHYVLAERILKPDSALLGCEHLATIVGAPVVMFVNHLSYSDANLVEVLLERANAEIADRLTVVAGPKVYSSLKRRFSSLCFATIKTPQSSGLSTEDAVMNPREVARAARQSIDIAHERLRLGDAVLVFAEGTRSRTSSLQELLAGATRYLDGPDVWILPAGITGTEEMFPIGDDTLHPVRCITTLGRPFRASALRARAGANRRLTMDVAGLAIAELLPPSYRGVYAETVPNLDDARAILRELHSAPS